MMDVLEVNGTYRAAAVTRLRAVVKLAGRGRCRATAHGLELDGFAATTLWAWALALLVVLVALAVAGLAHARLPGAPAVEDVAPPLVLLGLFPLMSLDALPTGQPKQIDARWDRIRDVSLASVGRRRMVRIEIEGLGSVDFCPDGDAFALYLDLRGRLAVHQLHRSR